MIAPETPWRRYTRPALAAAAVVAGVALLLTFAPAREAAAQFLQLFRVQNIAVIRVPEARMEQLQGIEEALESGVFGTPTMQREPGDEQPAASVAEASERVGFTVREPGYLPEGLARQRLVTATGPAIALDVSREQLVQGLALAGVTDVTVPEGLEVAQVGFDVPAVALQEFAGLAGGLERGAVLDGSSPESPAGRPGAVARRWAEVPGVMLAQAPQPKVTLPEGMDQAALGTMLLQLLGISQAEAARLAATIDWTTTLVLPLPEQVAEYREVEVDGVAGLLVMGRGDRAGRERMLLWQRDGIVHALGAHQVSDAELLRIADSLR
jgi:hypothetical protein